VGAEGAEARREGRENGRGARAGDGVHPAMLPGSGSAAAHVHVWGRHEAEAAVPVVTVEAATRQCGGGEPDGEQADDAAGRGFHGLPPGRSPQRGRSRGVHPRDGPERASVRPRGACCR
jgi:hypothetical protein